MGKSTSIRLGTRGSQLALVQAHHVADLIHQQYPHYSCEIVTVKTSGDASSAPIQELGGKGVFIKELEHALVASDIDLAVHSFKDITTASPASLTVSGFIKNERVTDAFILFEPKHLASDTLVMATGSARRMQLAAHLYPAMTCVPIRGNIDTRIQLAKANGYDGLIVSTAGLQRLNLTSLIHQEGDPTQFIPAPGQGLLALQHREGDDDVASVVAGITRPADNHLGQSYYRLLTAIGFDCNWPLGVYIESESAIHVFLYHNGAHVFTCASLDDAIERLQRYA